jgi:hypothetical protein
VGVVTDEIIPKNTLQYKSKDPEIEENLGKYD